MAKRAFELYLDESGDFTEGAIEPRRSSEASLVGGLLAEQGKISAAYALELLGSDRVHCSEVYDHRYINVLERLIGEGSRFVIFENKERLQVVNSDTTYLNIVSEGLVKLLRDLSNENPEGVSIEIIIANRREMAADSGIIRRLQYTQRLDEKILIALGRDHVNGCDYSLRFEDARKYRPLDFADIICNTYYTKRRKKFSADEKARIERIYDSQMIYSVFEDAMTVYIKRLMLERHYGEALFQICTLPKLTKFTKLRDQVIHAIEVADPYEQDTWFQQMSLIIGQYNNLRMYKDGILLAENYIRYFLNQFSSEGYISRMLPFWRFDTNYYLLTMYDHIGNTEKCQEHLYACRRDITSVNRSWEHIDYYFGFCIRELNVLMGRYAFEEVIEKSEQLIHIFTEARDLFGMIKTYNGVEQAVKSELLGKVYGVQLEAMINLIYRRPELIEKAIQLSDKAMVEFTDPRDVSRQYQWRCLLMIQANRPMDAYNALVKAVEGEHNCDTPRALIDGIYATHPGTLDFLLWHYTNLILSLKEANDPMGDAMAHELLQNQKFLSDYANEEKKGHPWNLVLWNVGRYYRCDGNYAEYNRAYNIALAMTREHKENVTMFTFALSMSADKLLWDRSQNGIIPRNSDFDIVAKDLLKEGITDEMCTFFGLKSNIGFNKLTNDELTFISKAYLK